MIAWLTTAIALAAVAQGVSTGKSSSRVTGVSCNGANPSFLAAGVNATLLASQSPLLSVSNPIISFFWGTRNDTDLNLEQCQAFEFTTSNNTLQTPIGPFWATFAPVGFQPQVMSTGSVFYEWHKYLPNLPVVSSYSASSRVLWSAELHTSR